MPKSISVIIPVYNDKENLEKCLTSLFVTEFKDFEVVVVDDGSGQDVASIVNRFSCKFIKLSSNKGQAYARNAGVKESQGDIILFTDSDCLVMKDWVRIMSEELIRSNHDSKDIIAVGARLESGKGFFQVCHAFAGYAYVQGGARRFVDYLNTAGVAIYKKSFLEVGGFSEDMRVSEDQDLALKLVEKGCRIVFEPSIYVFHNHKVRTLRQLLLEHLRWGKNIGLKLFKRHKNQKGVLARLLLNPFTHLLLLIPIAFLTTAKIICYNIREDNKVLIYALFIFLSKIFFRWGIFLGRRNYA